MDKNIILSYLTMRKAIGILAIAFPFILILGGILGGIPIQLSFSAYYWTSAIVLFVGMLTTFGIFLLSYKGYDKMDNIITSIAGVAMILVAIFPMMGGTSYLLAFIPANIVHILHFIFATSTFVSLGVMSFFQFTKSGENETTVAKEKRNKVYRISGIVIFVSIIAMAISQFLPLDPTFVLETAVLWAFGISWLVKGEAILKD